MDIRELQELSEEESGDSTFSGLPILLRSDLDLILDMEEDAAASTALEKETEIDTVAREVALQQWSEEEHDAGVLSVVRDDISEAMEDLKDHIGDVFDQLMTNMQQMETLKERQVKRRSQYKLWNLVETEKRISEWWVELDGKTEELRKSCESDVTKIMSSAGELMQLKSSVRQWETAFESLRDEAIDAKHACHAKVDEFADLCTGVLR